VSEFRKKKDYFTSFVCQELPLEDNIKCSFSSINQIDLTPNEPTLRFQTVPKGAIQGYLSFIPNAVPNMGGMSAFSRQVFLRSEGWNNVLDIHQVPGRRAYFQLRDSIMKK
jgi:hypothetical protein